MAETLSIISIISFVISGVALVLAVFCWIKFDIPSVIGDLSGRTAKKSIERMRSANEKSGNKSYRPSSTNAARGKITDTMPDSDKLNKNKTGQIDDRPETGLLEENKAVVELEDETGVLESNASEDAETGLLDDEETGMLNEVTTPIIPRTGGKKISVVEEVMLIHTDEVVT